MKLLVALFGNVVGLVILIAIAVLFPFMFIWALNTLFPALVIPYTIETWAAALVLQIFVKSKIEVNKQ